MSRWQLTGKDSAYADSPSVRFMIPRHIVRQAECRLDRDVTWCSLEVCFVVSECHTLISAWKNRNANVSIDAVWVKPVTAFYPASAQTSAIAHNSVLKAWLAIRLYNLCVYSQYYCACVIVFQVYDLRQVPSWSQLTSSTTLFIGAAAGPSHVIGTLAEVWIFIARQHTDARYWYSNSVCPSVRPSVRLSVYLSVRNVPVSDENGLTYCHSFFQRTGAQSF